MDEKMKELSQVLPSEIEARSFEIITEELGERTFPEKEAPIVKRVIHTTADFEYADSLVFSPGAVDKALEALKNGACIVTDTNMGKSGINKRALASLGGEVYCFMADEDVAKKAAAFGTTRAVASMDISGERSTSITRWTRRQKWEKTVFLQLGMHRPRWCVCTS